MNILGEKIHDNRLLRLIGELLQAGYLEEWRWHATYSGTPQGSILSPILANLVLDKLDKYVEQELIPVHTKGKRRKTYPPYVALTRAASTARKEGRREDAQRLTSTKDSVPRSP